jgi:hypothetical protein
MTEACVHEKQGTYLFCDTDSLAIVSSEKSRKLSIPGGENTRILPWREVREIADRFISLNPYDPKAVKGSILNLVDANFVDCDPGKPQRQLYGYSIAAKRYALYEKPSKSKIRIVDPKAHGVGFLYPPKNSEKGWDSEVPQWIYEMWEYVRSSLSLKAKTPDWVEVPQMMRLNITTYNVLEMLGNWECPTSSILSGQRQLDFPILFERCQQQSGLWEKWESRGFCGISKGGGKRGKPAFGFPRFPPPVFFHSPAAAVFFRFRC